MPTATDEPTEEPALEDSADAPESLNGAGEPESLNGLHGSHDLTVAADADAGPEAAGPEPEPEAEEPAAPAVSVFDPEAGREPTAPAASVYASGPEPAAPVSSIFVHDPDLPSTPPSMFTDDGELPLPAAPAAVPGEEPPARSDDPFSAYRFGPAREQDDQADAGYTSGHEPDYVPGYAAETGYNHGMTQPVEEASAPPPAYPADLPAAPATSARAAGARSAFASAYRALPRPKPGTRPQPRSRGEVATARRANLVIARLEPWSVMKFSFLMSLVAWIVLFVAVALLYYALSGLGVFDSIQKTLASVTSSTSSSGVNLAKWTSASRVLGYTMLIGAVDVILITALSTIGAMVYNLVTHLGGGIEVTLRETD